MNVERVGTLRLKKRNRENNKPLHERPHETATHREDTVEELFFSDTPFAFAGEEE